MKALILAAGFGSRLLPLTEHAPKAMVEVNGEPILFRQIRNLLEHGVHDITVIAGYYGAVIEARVRDAFPDVRVIISADYATTNNMYSAYLGQEAMAGGAFIMMNADVYYDASIVGALIDFPAENAIVTDVGRYYEESMKVIERDGRIVEISKAIAQPDALGASIDVYKFSPAGGKAFFAKCAEYIFEKNERNLWSEVALNDILGAVVFGACPCSGRWVEIDNLDDLRMAESIFA